MSAGWTTCRIQDAEQLASVLSEKLDDDAPLNLRTRWLPLAEELWRRITPVLDADGLPVVTTVGDLTARHLGKRVQVEGCAEGHVYKMVSSGMSPVYPRIRLAIENDDDCWWLPAFPLDTPCEVLP